jgi:hypothetical protein
MLQNLRYRNARSMPNFPETRRTGSRAALGQRQLWESPKNIDYRFGPALNCASHGQYVRLKWPLKQGGKPHTHFSCVLDGVMYRLCWNHSTSHIRHLGHRFYSKTTRSIGHCTKKILLEIFQFTASDEVPVRCLMARNNRLISPPNGRTDLRE